MLYLANNGRWKIRAKRIYTLILLLEQPALYNNSIQYGFNNTLMVIVKIYIYIEKYWGAQDDSLKLSTIFNVHCVKDLYLFDAFSIKELKLVSKRKKNSLQYNIRDILL